MEIELQTSAPRPIFSASGTWLAFVTDDNLVWRPDVHLLGHVVHGNVFTTAGTYVGTIEGNVLTWHVEKAGISVPRPDVPVNVPGYPGLPAPNFIRAAAPGSLLDYAASAPG